MEVGAAEGAAGGREEGGEGKGGGAGGGPAAGPAALSLFSSFLLLFFSLYLLALSAGDSRAPPPQTALPALPGGADTGTRGAEQGDGGERQEA